LFSQNKRTKQKAALKAPCGFTACLKNNGNEGNSLILRSNNLHPDPLFPAILAALKGSLKHHLNKDISGHPPTYGHIFYNR